MTDFKKVPRLRIFAGPNGSGKSTVINSIRNYKTSSGQLLNFGYYINADDIAKQLRDNSFSFISYGLNIVNKEFTTIALASGLINDSFTAAAFKKSYTLISNVFKLKDKNADERLAQILADFLRKKLLSQNDDFSFETVFSHTSKVDIIKEASRLGYKVYLYFVSTESPDINKFRVLSRKAQGGHDVPPHLIESRYYRSLDFLYEACQYCYQVFFFDNSVDGSKHDMFAHFKLIAGKKKWDEIDISRVPNWFINYYSAKVTTT